MAIIKVCDLCKGHPLDLDAKSGGDVRSVVIDIEADAPEPLEHYKFDACGPCRRRLFGEIFENIAPTARGQAKEKKEPSIADLQELIRARPRTERRDGSGARWPRPAAPPGVQIYKHAS